MTKHLVKVDPVEPRKAQANNFLEQQDIGYFQGRYTSTKGKHLVNNSEISPIVGEMVKYTDPVTKSVSNRITWESGIKEVFAAELAIAILGKDNASASFFQKEADGDFMVLSKEKYSRPATLSGFLGGYSKEVVEDNLGNLAGFGEVLALQIIMSSKITLENFATIFCRSKFDGYVASYGKETGNKVWPIDWRQAFKNDNNLAEKLSSPDNMIAQIEEFKTNGNTHKEILKKQIDITKVNGVLKTFADLSNDTIQSIGDKISQQLASHGITVSEELASVVETIKAIRGKCIITINKAEMKSHGAGRYVNSMML